MKIILVLFKEMILLYEFTKYSIDSCANSNINRIEMNTEVDGNFLFLQRSKSFLIYKIFKRNKFFVVVGEYNFHSML